MMNDVTKVLYQIEAVDQHAAEQLLPLVYDELRKLAAAKLALEKPGHTLQATALVHEAFVRLLDVPEAQSWSGRSHFFAAAAEAMRRILVEHARRRKAAKRGGDAHRQPLHDAIIAASRSPEEILMVNDALDRLAEIDPLAATLVKLRFFAGLTASEAAAVLGMSVRSAHDVWVYARTWLRQEIGRS